MLRITAIAQTNGGVRLRLDGSIGQSSFDELAGICADYKARQNTSITLDMSGVGFMSNHAAASLAALKSDGLELINCSAFIEMLIVNAEAKSSVGTEKALHRCDGKK